MGADVVFAPGAGSVWQNRVPTETANMSSPTNQREHAVRERVKVCMVLKDYRVTFRFAI
jgi:hypothetical protein